METVMDNTIKQDIGKKSIEDKNMTIDILDDIYELASHIGTVAYLLSEYYFKEKNERLERAAYMILEDSDEIMSLIDNESGEDHNEGKGPLSHHEKEKMPERYEYNP
jgi:hypothetical protein